MTRRGGARIIKNSMSEGRGGNDECCGLLSLEHVANEADRSTRGGGS
eukprot:SAG31_NODE_3198_length_4565_cov_4.748097_5_plen_47_part_00